MSVHERIAGTLVLPLLSNSRFYEALDDFGPTHGAAMIAMVERDARRRLETLEASILRSELAAIRATANGLAGLLSHFGYLRAAHLARIIEASPINAALMQRELVRICERSFSLAVGRFREKHGHPG